MSEQKQIYEVDRLISSLKVSSDLIEKFEQDIKETKENLQKLLMDNNLTNYSSDNGTVTLVVSRKREFEENKDLDDANKKLNDAQVTLKTAKAEVKAIEDVLIKSGKFKEVDSTVSVKFTPIK